MTTVATKGKADARPGFDREGKTFNYGHQFIVQMEGDADAPAGTIAMQTPDDLAKQFKALLKGNRFTAPKKISLNACSSERYAADLDAALFRNGIKTDVSGRSIAFTVDETGHKMSLGPNPEPVGAHKTTYRPDAQGQPVAMPGSPKQYAGKVTAIDAATRMVTVTIPAAGLRSANTETIAIGKDAIHHFNLGDNVTLRRTERGPVIEPPEMQAKLSRTRKLPWSKS